MNEQKRYDVDVLKSMSHFLCLATYFKLLQCLYLYILSCFVETSNEFLLLMGILAPLRHRFLFYNTDLVSESGISPNIFSYFKREPTGSDVVLAIAF